ncbi:MAG: DUF4247 domain-containing protein [Firmicutes bacterium]|nr:DUF4247 domain-containing protein [Bacillota bacterium]
MMEKRDIIVSLGVLILIIFIVGGLLTGRGPNIVKAVDKKYSLKSVEGPVKTYDSKDDLNMTVNSISSLKKPYDQKIDSTGKSILLYDEAVIIVEDKGGHTEIELIEDHKTAYRRHHNTMIFFWGNNLYRNGRIRTPRSIRKGSIGSSSSRGGGFGFGK